MALNLCKKMSSPYYPQRARWYSRFYYWRMAARRVLALDRIHVPRELSVLGFVGGFLVPGLAVLLRRPRYWGMLAMATCAVLFLFFMVWLGYPSGNFAIGLMISIHVSGFAYYCSPVLRNQDFWHRILFTTAIFLSLVLLLYAPLWNVIQNHWVMPLRTNGEVVIVGKIIPAGDIRRGDRIAYTLSGYHFSNHFGQGVSSQKSLALGAVLAAAGDRVEFSTDKFTVNGVTRPSLPHMPDSGNLVVPENHWFIWPNIAITGNWNVGEANISTAMLQMADVTENQYVGKPFNHWLWRKQIMQ